MGFYRLYAVAKKECNDKKRAVTILEKLVKGDDKTRAEIISNHLIKKKYNFKDILTKVVNKYDLIKQTLEVAKFKHLYIFFKLIKRMLLLYENYTLTATIDAFLTAIIAEIEEKLTIDDIKSLEKKVYFIIKLCKFLKKF